MGDAGTCSTVKIKEEKKKVVAPLRSMKLERRVFLECTCCYEVTKGGERGQVRATDKEDGLPLGSSMEYWASNQVFEDVGRNSELELRVITEARV